MFIRHHYLVISLTLVERINMCDSASDVIKYKQFFKKTKKGGESGRKQALNPPSSEDRCCARGPTAGAR